MSSAWPALPFEAWQATRDTLHAHTQVLGKLAAALAPPEPQLQHTALRLSARGWETLPLPADRKSTRLNSSHLVISYAVFCLKKKKSMLAQATIPHGVSERQPLLVCI